MSGETQLLLMIAGVHLLGLACVAILMFPALRGDGLRPIDPPSDSGSDDGRGNDRLRPKGPTVKPRGGIPLPDAEQSRVRLRDERRLAEHLPRPQRRPAREPARTPTRTPARTP
jgi:hypothetical protein